MLKNPTIKNIISALVIALAGYILLNAAFLLDYLFQTLITRAVGFFIPPDINPMRSVIWYPPLLHILFMLFILGISILVFRSKLPTLAKATYMTVPLATVFVTFGIAFHPWPLVPFLLGGALAAGLLAYFWRTRQPWLYSYTVILVASVLAVFFLSGGEI